LEQWWKPGLLCIGDAAHAMSPVGGIGINLAIQDAVATANILALSLANPAIDPLALTPFLAKVQTRRLFPTRVTQAAQVAIQDRILVPVVNRKQDQPLSVPWPLRLLNLLPVLRGIPAYAVGVGVRPEHVYSPANAKQLPRPAPATSESGSPVPPS
jgi:2-polyprenyl-6-methoxyphenol hydroxylase-like FAD-dependent oxidoreductase